MQITVLLGFALSSLLGYGGYLAHQEFSVLKGPYLGQEPPGMTPEVFAPGIVSTKNHIEFSGTFTPDGNEFYFTRRPPDGENYIYFTVRKNNRWSKPERADFPQGFWSNEPNSSPDGERLFFGSKIPLTGTDAAQKGSIWMTRRIGSNWSRAEFVGSGMMYVTSTNTGTIYYTDKSGGTAEECFLAKRVVTEQGYSAQIPLNSPLDKKGYAHPFIAPDAGYIIFDYQDEFFISFQSSPETWTTPVNLSKRIRGNATGLCAYVSPDDRYLFFSRFEKNATDGSMGSDIYWVEAGIIEEIKREELSK